MRVSLFWANYGSPVDLLHKSHHAPVPYPTMHYCVIKKSVHVCTILLQNSALQDICLVHCGICEMGLLQALWRKFTIKQEFLLSRLYKIILHKFYLLLKLILHIHHHLLPLSHCVKIIDLITRKKLCNLASANHTNTIRNFEFPQNCLTKIVFGLSKIDPNIFFTCSTILFKAGPNNVQIVCIVIIL